MSTEERTSASPEAVTQKNHHKWWQWVLLYPTLFISVFAAIPTYIETIRSLKIGVEYGESKQAKQQADFWKRNLSCTAAPLDPLVTPNNTKVDATICKTGDVLVKIFTPDGNEYYRWVGIENIVNNVAFNIGLINSAYAEGFDFEAGLIASNPDIYCQKYVDSARLLRRVSVPGQGCFDEIINVYTGRVESKRAAPCNSQCQP